MVRRLAMAAVMILTLCISVAAQSQSSVTAPKEAIVGEVFHLEVSVPSNGHAKVECAISLDTGKVQMQSLPKAEGCNIEFRGMTLVMTRRASSTEGIRLQMKLKVLPVAAQTKTAVAFSFTGEGNAALGSVVHEITVVEPPSYENFLTMLSVEGGELSPRFHPDVLQYSATVPADCQKPQFHAVGAPKSRVEVSQTEFSQEGICTATVLVTAENGSRRTYTIQVTREKPEETLPETTAQSGETQPVGDYFPSNKNEGVPGWLVAAGVLAGAAIGGAGGILISQKNRKDR